VAAQALKSFNQSEHRRDRRVKVMLRGRYMLSDRREYPCRTIDISAGGLAIVGSVRGKIGECVVVYLDRVGRVEGTIVRHFVGGFALALHASSLKRDWLNLEIGKLIKQQPGRAPRQPTVPAFILAASAPHETMAAR
jgi:hypothetical protein